MISFKRYRLEIFCALACLMLSYIVSYGFMSKPLGQWYFLLKKPSFNPPSYVFGPMWTMLYLCMGIALGRLLGDVKKHFSLILLFGLQFILNIIWTPLFFGLQRVGLALIDLVALYLVVFIFLIKAWEDRVVFGLFIPYFLWLSFALMLNASIYFLNF